MVNGFQAARFREKVAEHGKAVQAECETPMDETCAAIGGFVGAAGGLVGLGAAASAAAVAHPAGAAYAATHGALPVAAAGYGAGARIGAKVSKAIRDL
ncbi:hypothetical protein ACIBF1_01155 [Spirillospora sp. NPDC050679]